jgi:hypothetical protein
MLLDGPDYDLPPIEHPVPEVESNHQWTNDLTLSPKRRRLDSAEANSSSLPRAFEAVSSIESHRPANETFRFTHSSAHPTPSAVPADAGGTHRPAFIRPSVQPQEPSEPLSDAFSPHRRGPRFVPGGMAATLQQWVLETGQAAIQSRKGKGYLRGEDYVMRVKVDQVRGDGPFTLHAKLSSGDLVSILLVGGNRAGSGRLNEIHPSSVIGIRAPTWEVEFSGRMYTVGVDWRTLS